VSVEGSYTSLDRKVHDLQISLSGVSSQVSDVEDAVGRLEDIPRRVDSLVTWPVTLPGKSVTPSRIHPRKSLFRARALPAGR
jgi:hypothetical protein